MKKLFSAILVLGLFASCLLAEHTKIGGKWQLSLDTPHGTVQGALELQQDGSKLTGTYDGPHGAMRLTGTVDGTKVSFSLEVPGGQESFAFSGALEGSNKMTGSTAVGGSWAATRE